MLQKFQEIPQNSRHQIFTKFNTAEWGGGVRYLCTTVVGGCPLSCGAHFVYLQVLSEDSDDVLLRNFGKTTYRPCDVCYVRSPEIIFATA
jgi:hypothetical protein